MNVKSYILSVAALVILSEIARLILPDGKTKKAAEIVFALIVVVTLLSPIFRLKDADLSFEYDDANYVADEYFVEKFGVGDKK